jgi:hypothetical protein
MTPEERKEIARRLIVDLDDNYFQEIWQDDLLRDFYGVKCDCEPIPTTAICAKNEARRIIGEPEASKLLSKALNKRSRL